MFYLCVMRGRRLRDYYQKGIYHMNPYKGARHDGFQF